MRVYGLVMQKIPLFIQAYDLASCPEPRVYGQYAFLSYRRGEKQLSEILSEYPYGFDVCLFLGFLDDFV